MIKQVLAMSAFGIGLLLAGAAMAQTQPSMAQQPANRMMSSPPVWHDNVRAERRAENVGDLYTGALNTLYAHGFRGVHHLSLKNDAVQATAITPRGAQRRVLVQPGTHQISFG